MRESPSRYGGFAAVIVLSLGLLMVGYHLPPEHSLAPVMRLMGVVGLVFGPVGFAVALAKTPARKTFFTAIGAMIYAGLFAYHAASNEISGSARYHRNVFAKADVVESVTRDAAPVKFRRATNYLWAGSGLCLGIALVSLAVSRKPRDVEPERQTHGSI